jgi:predicted transcriptional regulator of viral defense system
MPVIDATPTVDPDALRLRQEFGSTPALILTAPQVARLLAIRVDRATDLLAVLEAEGWLMRCSGGKYRRSEPMLA